MKTISNKTIKKNLVLSVGVQLVSLLVSFILNLIVPKYISELQYAHWQTYILYVGYVGILHFGLLDGIVLRYSQFDYDELDKPRIRSQFKLLLLTNVLMSIGTILLTSMLAQNEMKWVFFFVALGIIIKNIFTFTSYSFQITNRISKYAVLILCQRLAFGLITVVLLLFRVRQFQFYCMAELGGDIVGCVVGYYYNHDLYFGKSLPIMDAIREYKTNISAGIMLLVANWASMLLIGGAKMVIQWRWDKLASQHLQGP